MPAIIVVGGVDVLGQHALEKFGRCAVLFGKLETLPLSVVNLSGKKANYCRSGGDCGWAPQICIRIVLFPQAVLRSSDRFSCYLGMVGKAPLCVGFFFSASN